MNKTFFLDVSFEIFLLCTLFIVVTMECIRYKKWNAIISIAIISLAIAITSRSEWKKMCSLVVPFLWWWQYCEYLCLSHDYCIFIGGFHIATATTFVVDVIRVVVVAFTTWWKLTRELRFEEFIGIMIAMNCALERELCEMAKKFIGQIIGYLNAFSKCRFIYSTNFQNNYTLVNSFSMFVLSQFIRVC